MLGVLGEGDGKEEFGDDGDDGGSLGVKSSGSIVLMG
jgi:hypothetical protein